MDELRIFREESKYECGTISEEECLRQRHRWQNVVLNLLNLPLCPTQEGTTVDVQEGRQTDQAEFTTRDPKRGITLAEISEYERLTSKQDAAWEKKASDFEDKQDEHFYYTLIEFFSSQLESGLIDDRLCECKVVEALKSRLLLLKWKFDLNNWASTSDRILTIRCEVSSRLVSPKFLYHTLILKYQNSYRKPVATGLKLAEDYNRVLTSLVNLSKIFWSATPQICEDLCLNHVIPNMTRDLEERFSNRIHAHSRLLQLFSSNKFCFDMLLSGQLFHYWETKLPTLSCQWEAIWTKILAKAVKYAWASGQVLTHDQLKPYWPRMLAQLSKFGLHVPLSTIPNLPPSSDEKVRYTLQQCLCSALFMFCNLYGLQFSMFFMTNNFSCRRPATISTYSAGSCLRRRILQKF